MAKTGSQMINRQVAALKAAQGMSVEAGWFSSDRYPAEKGESVGRSVAAVARLNEFGGTIQHPGGTKYIDDAIVGGKAVGARFVGPQFVGATSVTAPHTINIPARPFMRLAWTNFKANHTKVYAKLAKSIVGRRTTPEQALAQVGMELENQIAKSIKSGQWVANAPSTISKKGFDKPLIDTAHMLQTVNSKVTK